MSNPPAAGSGTTVSGILDQAKTVASQAYEQASNLANQAANSQAAASVTETAKSLGTQAVATASSVATTVQQQAHSVAPTIIPPPASGVDRSDDLSPSNEKDLAKMDKLFAERATAQELQNKNVLQGAPNDALAGKKKELEKSMNQNKLDKELASRPQPADLVSKGILKPDEAPPA